MENTIMTYKENQQSRIIKVRWSDEEIRDRLLYRCSHGHTGVQHPACYNRDLGIEERKGCVDIEAGNLKADFGIMLSWAIKTSGKDEIVYDHVTKEDLESGTYDARIVSTLIDSMWEYDRVITHYGNANRFDIPFIRARYLWLLARGIYKGERMPGYGEMYQTDTYTMAKKLLAISSRRQNVIANTIQGIDVKTPIDRDYWLDIQYGTHDQRAAAIEYIVDHNIHDVEQLDENYLRLLPFVRETKTSI
jgi:DNA polymerase elongation subunit (family B)